MGIRSPYIRLPWEDNNSFIRQIAHKQKSGSALYIPDFLYKKTGKLANETGVGIEIAIQVSENLEVNFSQYLLWFSLTKLYFYIIILSYSN